MRKIVEYLEEHLFIRSVLIISAIVGLIVSMPIVYQWLFNGKESSKSKKEYDKTESLFSDTSQATRYFIPTHIVLQKDTTQFYPVRYRSLSKAEQFAVARQTPSGKEIDAHTILSYIKTGTRIKIIGSESSAYKIVYYDGEECIRGFISYDVHVTKIIPVDRNPYGVGNSGVFIYSRGKKFSIDSIFFDDKHIGTLDLIYQEEIKCGEFGPGIISLTPKAGYHILRWKDNSMNEWEMFLDLEERECFIADLSTDEMYLQLDE